MFSFDTTEGRGEIINFIFAYYSQKPLKVQEIAEFYDYMLSVKQYEGVIIGISLLIKENRFKIIYEKLKKRLSDPSYLDYSEPFAKNLATALTNLHVFDSKLGNLGFKILDKVAKEGEK